jgi:hypothetical protein
MPSPNGQRDGCGCLAWVKRCAHWDDWVLTLSRAEDTPLYGEQAAAGLWLVSRADDHPRLIQRGLPFVVASYDSLPAAEAEFHQRAAAMLGREK